MSRQAPNTLVAALSPELGIEVQMQWAYRLAEVRGLDLRILHRVEGDATRIIELDIREPVKGEGATVAHTVRGFIDATRRLRAGARPDLEVEAQDEESEKSGDDGERILHVELSLIQFDSWVSLRRTVLAELAKEGVELFTIAHEHVTRREIIELARERWLLYRYIPCEAVLCNGLDHAPALTRPLVVTSPTRNGEAALRLGLACARHTNGTLTALHVNQDVGADAEHVGARRIARTLEKALGPDSALVERKVVVDDQTVRGVRRVWDEGDHDLVITAMPRRAFDRSLGVRLGKGVPVAFVRAATPVRNRVLQFVEEGVAQLVPQIEREERIDLVDRLQSSAAWNFDFLILMVLATGMAAIGLIQDSAAVVIGAMLVAPLMTPLLGLGLALVQGNPVLARLSLRSITFGVAVSMLVATGIGLLARGFDEPTREMLGRGGPGMLDLVVAFLAGLAAAYASGRKNLIAALPGVAIAAALVPPIATSGLALALGDFVLAFNALLLFCINMVTIVLAAMVSLRAVGLSSGPNASRLTRLVGNTIAVAVLGLGIYLGLRSKHEELTQELPPGLLTAVEEALPAPYRLTAVSVAYDELGVRLNLDIIGWEPAPEALAKEIRGVASDHYEQPVRVRLLTQLAVGAGHE